MYPYLRNKDYDMESPVLSKGRKFFTKEEVLEKLATKENCLNEVSRDICEELCPFDVTDEEALQVEDRLERMERGILAMRAKFTSSLKHSKSESSEDAQRSSRKRKYPAVSIAYSSLRALSQSLTPKRLTQTSP